MSGSRQQLGRRFVLAGIFLGSASWVTYAVNFAISIFLARLLGPEAFGLYAFVLAINELVNILGAFSLGLALIQDAEESQSRYDTALALYGALTLVGLAVSLAIAPVLWNTRGADGAWFLLALAGGRVFVLAAQVPQAMLERRLQYGAVSATRAISGTLPNFLALGLAWQGMGAWCLVIRDLLVGLLHLAVGWVWSGYRFRGEVRREAAARLMPFARQMFFARGLEILLQRIDRFAVGVFFGNAATGLYDRARFLSEAGIMTMRPISQLSFNLYARTQEDRARLTRSFELLHFFLGRTMLAGAGTLIAFPEETVRLILGEEWLDAAPLLRWLGLYGGVLPLLVNVCQLFNGVGHVARYVRINAIRLVIFVPGILLAGWLDRVEGVAIALLASTLVVFVLAWRQRGHYLESRGRERPVGALLFAVVVGACLAAGRAGWLEAVPWALRPFLPPLLFGLGVLVADGRKLFAELRYLRAILRPTASEQA